MELEGYQRDELIWEINKEMDREVAGLSATGEDAHCEISPRTRSFFSEVSHLKKSNYDISISIFMNSPQN